MGVLKKEPEATGSLWLGLVFEMCYRLGGLARLIVQSGVGIGRVWGKRMVILAVVGAAAYYRGAQAIAATANFVSTLPVLRIDLIVGLFALALCLFAVACVVYIAFSFLERLLLVDAQIANNLRSIPMASRPVFQAPAAIKKTDGEFIPYDEERQFVQEELERLQASGVMQGVTAKEFMEDHNFVDAES